MASAAPAIPTGFARIFAWPRVRFTLAVSAAFGVLLGITNETATLIIIVRAIIVGGAICLSLDYSSADRKVCPDGYRALCYGSSLSR